MVTRETYQEQAGRRFGRWNPEWIDVEHWVEMVRSGESAYAAAARHLGDAAAERTEPGWSFDRFGMTRTRLPDGSVVCVGGEHEDHYDPDFCIYNDVVVVDPAGGGVSILGYPQDVFPPTDFHTATLVGDRIVLVGSLGYGGQRAYGQTPVYTLDLKTLAVSRVPTGGQGPGWISRHRAVLERDGRTIRISGGKIIRRATATEEVYEDNERVFRLDLRSGRWTAYDGDWLEPPAPQVEWPRGWGPLLSQAVARDVADGLARSVTPDHPLFADEYEPVAGGAGAVLLRRGDEPEEFIVSEEPTWCGRAEEPLKYETYGGIEAWLAAADRAGDQWW